MDRAGRAPTPEGPRGGPEPPTRGIPPGARGLSREVAFETTVGTHASGEVASKMAAETIGEFYQRTREDEDATWPYKMDRYKGYEENRLITGIKLANLRIYESAQRDPRLMLGAEVTGQPGPARQHLRVQPGIGGRRHLL